MTLPITPIDHRKQVILKAIVTDYVRTAEPVGSRTLMTHYSLGVKSATIRNEMAELAELGLPAPASHLRRARALGHGLPALCGSPDGRRLGSPRAEAADARDRLSSRRAEIDIILEQTCRILSDLVQIRFSRHSSCLATPTSATQASRVSARTSCSPCWCWTTAACCTSSSMPVPAKIDPGTAGNYLMRKLAGAYSRVGALHRDVAPRTPRSSAICSRRSSRSSSRSSNRSRKPTSPPKAPVT